MKLTTTGFRQYRHLPFWIIMFGVLFLIGCDNGPSSQAPEEVSKASLSFDLTWSKPPTHTPARSAPNGNVCDDYLIADILATLYDANGNKILSATWKCAQRSGILKAPFGKGYRVLVQGLVADKAVWEGEASGIDVVRGVQNKPVPITMSYKGKDKTAPTVQSTFPKNRAKGVNTSAKLRVTFNKGIIPGSLDEQNFYLVAENDDTRHGCSFDYSPESHTVTIEPKLRLAPNVSYTARISIDDETLVKDLAGNPMGSEFAWQFTTSSHSDSAPAVQSVLPGDEKIVVNLTPAIRAEFDVPMDRQTITSTNFVLYDSDGNAVEGQVDYSAEEQAAIFKPKAPLLANTKYRAAISDAVTNTDGIPMEQAYEWHFTTTGSSLTLIEPSNEKEIPCDDVPLKWSQVDGVASYHLQIASDSDFTNIVTNERVKDTTFNLPHAYIGTNFWRVQAEDSSQNLGPWSTAWQFKATRTQWMQRFGAPDRDDLVFGLEISKDNGILIAGQTEGVITLPESSDTNQYNGGQDIYLLKLDSDGKGVWIEGMGTETTDRAYAMATDANDDIYITGFGGEGLGPKVHENSEFFVSRFSSSGNKIWTQMFGTEESGWPLGVSTHMVNGEPRILITGYSGNYSDGGGEDIFVAQFDAAGTQLSWWLDDLPGYDRGHCVFVDGNGNTIVSGGLDSHMNLISYTADWQRNWTKDLGEKLTRYSYLKAAIHEDHIYVVGSLRQQVSPYVTLAFLGKFAAADGSQVWQHLIEITPDVYRENGINVAVDADGSVYVTGMSTVNKDNHYAMYIAKFNPQNGELIWSETYDRTGVSLLFEGVAVKADHQGNVVVAGNIFHAHDQEDNEIFAWKLAGRDQ